jgi:peptide/nickel transport system permease protein
MPNLSAKNNYPSSTNSFLMIRIYDAIQTNLKAKVGLIILAIFLLVAIFASLLAPYDPNEMSLDMMSAPSFQHLLGTDDLGRDLFSRIIWGTQVSLFVGFITVAISMIVGVFLGVWAGYYGGWIDMIIMRYIDLQWAFPNFIIAVYLVAVFGTGLLNIIIAISLAFLDDFARVARSMVITIKEQPYIEAARVQGTSDFRIMFKHILPNSVGPIIVQASVSISYAILGEASLSFLGLGVNANTPTWGLILADGRSFISQAWWLGVFPGLAIMLIVLSINFIGDAVRDAFDIRHTEI